jgi:hypothetical protein
LLPDVIAIETEGVTFAVRIVTVTGEEVAEDAPQVLETV